MILLYHRGGPNACGGPAIGVHKLPSRYEIAADNVVLLDGKSPKRGDAMMCGTCKGAVHPQWLFASPERKPITV